ncbi:MAG: NADH-quinone oxidoreductase subunit NuoG [Acidimicrobiia bacterium]
MTEKVLVTIDGVEREVPDGTLLIKAAQDTGTYIPRFCWHERMKPVGMCRMCLVEIDSPRGPMLVTSCTTPVREGMVVDTESDTVKKAQEAVLELLLANHPLDCPVCDKGGECPLQDQALSHGPGESRFVEIKRHYEKPIRLSNLVLLDRERCILCARCTRFCEEISGDPLIEFKGRGNATEVNTFPDQPFSSYFSGNTVQICPVGALTAKPYRFRARPWDLDRVESSSLFDTAHPRIEVHASQNRLLRYLGVDNPHTNRGWLSDKDRFGFQYLDSPERVTAPLVRRDGKLVETDWAEALDIVANRLSLIRDDEGDTLAVLGGAQGTNEDAYALSKFARVVLGTNHIDSRMGDELAPHFLAATVDRARIDDLDSADTILVWGPDLKERHPTLYLRVRRAAQELDARLVVVHPRATGLDDRAAHILRYRPGAGFDLLQAIAAGEHPEVAAALEAEKVVALVGVASLADGPVLAEAVADLVRQRAGTACLLPLDDRANVYGALDMGLAPDLLPGRVALDSVGCANLAASWGDIPRVPGRDTSGILEGLASGELRGLVLVGADPVGDFPEPELAAEALDIAEFVVSVDLFLHDSNRNANVILPAAGFAEKEGTVTNIEGRIQKVNQIRPLLGQARPEWSVFDDLAVLMGAPLGLSSAELVFKELATVSPAYEGLSWAMVETKGRDGVVIPLHGAQPLNHIPVSVTGEGDRPPAGLALHQGRVMYDGGVRLRHCSSLAPLASGAVVYLHPADASRLGAEHGDRVRVSTRVGHGEFTLVVDEGTPQEVVYVPLNQPGAPALGTGVEVSLEVVG